MKFRKPFPIFPILFSIYPALALMASNLGEFEFHEGWRPIIISFIGCMILWVILKLIIKDWNVSAIITLMFMGFFFSYGHVYNLLKQFTLGGFFVGRHRFLLPVMFFLLLFGIYWVIKTAKEPYSYTPFLNWASLVLVLLPTFQIAYYAINDSQIKPIEGDVSNSISFDEALNTPLYDIYYIILDAYTRQDTLLAMYDYDNSEFIQSLVDLGFYVADCSQSNYPETYFSLVSSLNMEYLWSIEGLGSKKPTTLLVNNKVRRFLENHGYTTIAFETGIPWTEFKNADYYLSIEDAEKWLGDWSAINVISDFEVLFLKTTLAKAVWDAELFSDQFNPDRITYWKRRARILHALDQLKDINNIPGPKFIFVHILSPHKPFIFGPNGEEVVPNGDPKDEIDYAQGYTNQVTFLNYHILSTLEQIIQKSKNPPIIILQGDHGPSRSYGTSPEYRSTILNAYYLPKGSDQFLYPDITPVNTFRLILNHYFNAKFELLDDIHFDTVDIDDPEEYPVINNIGPICGK